MIDDVSIYKETIHRMLLTLPDSNDTIVYLILVTCKQIKGVDDKNYNPETIDSNHLLPKSSAIFGL